MDEIDLISKKLDNYVQIMNASHLTESILTYDNEVKKFDKEYRKILYFIFSKNPLKKFFLPPSSVRETGQISKEIWQRIRKTGQISIKQICKIRRDDKRGNEKHFRAANSEDNVKAGKIKWKVCI